ncbi:hypothetical protein FJZ27_04690 [Candidatus Peribacteria bacterium]|nr:hypothetical protein [Candidatus Peribacteria bacterium]
MLLMLVTTPTFADLKVQMKIGGYSVTATGPMGQTFATRRDADSIVAEGTGADAPRAEMIAVTQGTHLRAERNASFLRDVDQAIDMYRCKTPCKTGTAPKCADPCVKSSKPGSIPKGLGVQKWLNATKTSFRDQQGRTWNWVEADCAWVDP